MPDSVQVLDAGWQMPVNPSTRLPYADGIIYFFEAGTSDPLEVFSAADLDVSSSLGVSVSCNSLGFPVSSGNAKVLIYTGTDAYKVRITSATFGGTVAEFDDVRGALDTSLFLTAAAVSDLDIVPITADRAVTAADKGVLLDVNCTSGTLTITLADAADLGSGFTIGVRHNGTANQVKITGDGTDTFGISGIDVTRFALTGRGQVVWIGCDGTSFKIYSETPALVPNTTGVILVADRLSAPPGAPTPGARYILTSAPSGAWSTFALHDIAEADGFGGWFKYTPTTDCGWIAYVQDEDSHYTFAGTLWKGLAGAIAGLAENTTPATTTSFIGVHNSSTGATDRVSLRNAGPLRFSQSGTLTNVAGWAFTIPAPCDTLEINLWNWIPSVDNTDLRFQLSQGGVYLSGATDYRYGYIIGVTADNGNDGFIQVTSVWGNAALEYGHIRIEIIRPHDTAFRKSARWHGGMTTNAGVYTALGGAGHLTLNTDAIDGVSFFFSSGNIATGYYEVTARVN